MSLLKYISLFFLVLLCVIVGYLFSPVEWFVGTMSIVDNTTREKHILSQETFETEDGTLRYIDVGPRDGEVIVLLHGTPTSSWMYRQLIDILLEDGQYRIIAPDMLGYGTSDKPLGPALYTTKKQSDRLLALLASLDISSWNQVTHDIGGLWTRQMMIDSPGSIKKLLILNTLGFAEGFAPPVLVEKISGLGTPMARMMTTQGLTDMMFGGMIQDMSQITLSQDVLDGYISPFLSGQWRVYGYFLDSVGETKKYLADVQDEVLGLKDFVGLPETIVIRGAKDKNLLVNQTDFFQEKRDIPSENIFILEEEGHLLLEDESVMIGEKLLFLINENNEN